MAKNKPGGGLGSRVVTNRPVKTGMPARQQRPAGVSQIGSSIGNKSTDSGKMLTRSVEPVRAGPIAGVGSVKLGNEVAASTVCGPGGSRTVYGSGTQSQHGAGAGSVKPQGRPILSEFGPDVPGRR
jgi:hypothetical protein